MDELIKEIASDLPEHPEKPDDSCAYQNEEEKYPEDLRLPVNSRYRNTIVPPMSPYFNARDDYSMGVTY